MGLLDDISQRSADRDGTCETCGNLIHLAPNLIGCKAHDKLILPTYPPFHGNAKCEDWRPAEIADTLFGRMTFFEAAKIFEIVCTVEAMKAENASRESRDEAPAYGEAAFLEVRDSIQAMAEQYARDRQRAARKASQKTARRPQTKTNDRGEAE